MSSQQQELDQRIATLKEWLSEYKINEIKFPTTRPPIKTPSAPRPAGTTAEIPAATKPGAAGAEELVLGPGGKYYPKGEVPSEADILARQAEVDRRAAELTKRAGTSKSTAADISPGIRYSGGEPVHHKAFEPVTRPQVDTGLKAADGKPIMRPMTDAEIRAQEQAAIDAAKTQTGAADTAAKGEKGGLLAWAKANPIKAASLGLGAGLVTSPVTVPMALGLTGANLQAYWDKVTSAAETGAQMVAPLLPDRYQVQPGETPPTSTPQPVGRQDYKPPAATTAPPPPPPVKEESQHTFARMRELAGIAKKTL